MARCEDAPCCGCCGTNLYGENQEGNSEPEFDVDDYYEVVIWVESESE